MNLLVINASNLRVDDGIRANSICQRGVERASDPSHTLTVSSRSNRLKKPIVGSQRPDESGEWDGPAINSVLIWFIVSGWRDKDPCR